MNSRPSRSPGRPGSASQRNLAATWKARRRWWLSVWSAVPLLFLTAAPLSAQSRFEVRAVVGRHGWSPIRNEGLDEAAGVLTIDAETRRLRVELTNGPSFDVAFDALVALHYEESQYPRRWFGRTGLYLTVHHTSPTGQPEVAIFRLARDSAADCLAALEHDTGLPVDHSPTTTSFLGLPIHAGVGSVVYVTDDRGRTSKGTVAWLGPESIDLGASGRFDAPSIRTIQVRDPIWGGVAIGAEAGLAAACFAYLQWCQNGPCNDFGWAFGGMVATGGLVGGLIDAKVMRHAYHRLDTSGSPSVRWSPLLTGHALGLRMNVRF